MAYFRITYGCGCGENEDVLEFKNEQEAIDYAYQQAIEDYESFEGLHGIRSMREIAEEDFNLDFDELDYNTADWIDVETAYFDERESQLDYSAIEITEEEYQEEKNQ